MIYWAKKAKPKQPRKRIPFLNREKAAYVKLRRVGLSINQIADAFGRSRSAVHRAIKFAEGLGTLRRFSLRKLPAGLRRRSASFRWQTLMKLMPKWIVWITEGSEKPP